VVAGTAETSRLRSHAPRWAASALAATLCATALQLAPAPASAGQFSVQPVRIFLQARDRAAAITVANEGDTELVMQADLYQWKQSPITGEDELTLSEEMILAPPVLKLAPKAKQTVRLALLRPAPAGEVRNYRMIIREIPEARPARENAATLQLALAFSLPVFITPQGGKRQVACTVDRSAPTVAVATCENTGNAYAQIINFQLLDPAGNVTASLSTAGYILSGVKRRFELKKSDGPIPGGPLKLAVTYDDTSSQTFEVGPR
jgi:fimbrial chaperone protein